MVLNVYLCKFRYHLQSTNTCHIWSVHIPCAYTQFTSSSEMAVKRYAQRSLVNTFCKQNYKSKSIHSWVGYFDCIYMGCRALFTHPWCLSIVYKYRYLCTHLVIVPTSSGRKIYVQTIYNFWKMSVLY